MPASNVIEDERYTMIPSRHAKVVGTGLIALDVVVGPRAGVSVRSWTGGTCGNVLSILAWLEWNAFPIARMNGDAASQRIRTDMERWGVHLDWTNCAPTSHTPMIVQEILRMNSGRRNHRFTWSCLLCGGRLPGFKPVTVASVEKIKPEIAGTAVFFFDRVSRATLTLAAEASTRGAVVVFEPSVSGNGRLMAEAMSLAHIVKYAEGRTAHICRSCSEGPAPLLEVHTLGERGLRYRHRFGRGVSDWIYQKAFPVPRLADACGSGDWCTAGLIAKTAADGQRGLRRAGAGGVDEALVYGQALAAWNCSFEGARGGMYAVDRAEFDKQINDLMNDGHFAGISHAPVKDDDSAQNVACPACLSV